MPRDEHVPNDFLVHVDGRHGGGFDIFDVEESGVEDQDRAEVLVSADGIEESAFLNVGMSTISFSALEKSGGMWVFLKSKWLWKA